MNNDLLHALEMSKDIISMLAGVKKQASDAGFSEEIAELIALEILKKGGS